jgi:hypothetical protein
MNEDAERIGKERFPNDPVQAQRLTDSLKDHNLRASNVAKTEQTQRNLALQNTLTEVANRAMPNGRKPISEQEANSLDSHFSDWYQEAKRRNPMMALRIEGMFKANSKADNILPPAQIDRAKAEWAGMTNEQKVNVRPEDLFNKGIIDLKTKDMMLNEQNKMKSLSTNTNEADTVLRHYSSTLNDRDIFRSETNKEANARYIHLRGSLQLRIADEQQRLGRPVKMWTPEEEKRIVNQLITDVDSGEKHLWGSIITEPAYEHIYKTQVAPEMPAFVKKNAPNAEWSQSEQRWQTTINGVLKNIKVPPEEAGK